MLLEKPAHHEVTISETLTLEYLYIYVKEANQHILNPIM